MLVIGYVRQLNPFLQVAVCMKSLASRDQAKVVTEGDDVVDNYMGTWHWILSKPILPCHIVGFLQNYST